MVKQRKKTGIKVNIPIMLAAILFCLTLVSTYFSSGVVARYSTDTSGADTARVIRLGKIKLDVIDTKTQYIAPGVTLTWNAKVTFPGSEASTYVFLEVTPSGSCTVSEKGLTYAFSETVEGTNIDTGAVWTVDSDGADGWKLLKKQGNSYVYYLTLNPNEPLNEKPLFESDAATVSSDPAKLLPENISKLTAITTTFRASVIQSNGFIAEHLNDPNAAVNAAWDSLTTKHP